MLFTEPEVQGQVIPSNYITSQYQGKFNALHAFGYFINSLQVSTSYLPSTIALKAKYYFMSAIILNQRGQWNHGMC